MARSYIFLPSCIANTLNPPRKYKFRYLLALISGNNIDICLVQIYIRIYYISPNIFSI